MKMKTQMLLIIIFSLVSQILWAAQGEGLSNILAMDTGIPTVEVIFPNGGELFYGREIEEISWNCTDFGLTSQPITIEYSSNSGLEFYMITENEENDGSYSWTVPTMNSNEFLIKISAEDNFGYANNDISDTVFAVEYVGAEFSGNPTTVYLGNEVQFTDLSEGVIISWEWDFNNDSVIDSYEQNPLFEYSALGSYTVSLTVSDGTHWDTKEKVNYIDVVYAPPKVPENVDIDISSADAIITWDAVTENVENSPITPDGYIVLYSEVPDNNYYWYLNNTINLTYTHNEVGLFRDDMYYKVVAFINYEREQMEYLTNLTNSREKMKWSEVKRNLKRIK